MVINGSPYERNKDDTRLELCRRRAREAGMPLAYVNLVGGQDELVFDGDSLVVDHDGRRSSPVARSSHRRSCYVDLPPDAERSQPSIAARLADVEEVYQALVCGLARLRAQERFHVACLIGLSGGIDSALTAAIAVDALGPEHVFGVGMPSAYSSQHSRDDAADLAARTGLHVP